jgi:hypothetical protein
VGWFGDLTQGGNPHYPGWVGCLVPEEIREVGDDSSLSARQLKIVDYLEGERPRGFTLVELARGIGAIRPLWEYVLMKRDLQDLLNKGRVRGDNQGGELRYFAAGSLPMGDRQAAEKLELRGPAGWSECMRCGGPLKSDEERQSGICSGCRVLPT